MKIGLCTYGLFWEFDERNPDRLSIEQMIDRTADLECEVFQICDDPRIESYDDADLEALYEHAASRGVELELGTRRTDPAHLQRYIHKASLIGAKVLRSMVQKPEITDGLQPVIDNLTSVLPDLEVHDVTLALETYEQISSEQLVEIVKAVDSPRVGICLDPANCVSALEHPNDVIDRCAPYVTSLHVKDFAFSRNEGWVGFLYAGAKLGEGLLDLDYEVSKVYQDGRSPAAVVEHWVPWQGTIEESIRVEREWTQATIDELKARR